MTHEAAKKEIAAGTPLEVICATCPWDRLCVHPPTMTTQQVDQRIEQTASVVDGRSDRERAAALIVAASVFGGKDMVGAVCPVLALRLRDDRQVSDGIRGMMRAYQPPPDTPPTRT